MLEACLHMYLCLMKDLNMKWKDESPKYGMKSIETFFTLFFDTLLNSVFGKVQGHVTKSQLKENINIADNSRAMYMKF